jgi:Uma2 family endonuclease
VVQVPAKHRFNVSEYYRMGETGVLPPDARVELLDGEIFDMSPIGPFHGSVTKKLIRVFSGAARDRWILAVGDPVRLDDYSEPQPDIMLVKPSADFYQERHPQPSDVYLLIEVADTSLERDLNEKLPVYARSGIQEVWIVNLNEQTIEVYRQPDFTSFGSTKVLSTGEFASPEAFPDVRIDVGNLLKRLPSA